MLMLPILMYHKVAEIPPGKRFTGNYVLPGQFEEQLKAISRWGYTSITLEDWLDFRAGRRRAPHKPIALTFDDGYRCNYNIAWPLLYRHRMTATVFLVADLIGGANSWDVDEPQEPLLQPEEILAMQATGIQFGSHTCSHGSLIDMTPKDALRELTKSRATLTSLLGRPVVALAYPYNKQNRTVRTLARQAGYKAAVLGRGRINARWTNPHALMRIMVDAHTTVESLSRQLTRWRWLGGV